MNVLIIEDDREFALAVSEFLEIQGAECDFAYNGLAAVELATTQSFDCIILDLMLPKLNGIEVCKQLRSQHCNTPILMLTACDTDQDQVEGFDAGLDDYVTKPCHMPLLWARLQALLRRQSPATDCLRVGALCLYLKEHRAVREEQTLKLAPTSWKILEFLARHSPNVVSRTEIEDHVWPDEDVEAGTFGVHLHQLRKAVDKPFEYPLIQTHVGVGLSLRAEEHQ